MDSEKTAIIIASKENPLDAFAKELNSRKVLTRVLFREDMVGFESMERKALEVFSDLEKVDYLVISALQNEQLEKKTIDMLSEEEYREWKYYSLVQFYHINRCFIGRMVETGGGCVFGICSQSGITSSKNLSLDGASGAALIMGLKCLAEESHEENIFTNAVGLGAIEENEHMHSMNLDAQIVKHIPSGYVMTEEQAVKKIADLMQLTDSSFTGNALSIDAAFSCSYMREW